MTEARWVRTMPLRKHRAVSVAEMNWWSPKETLCQLFREIYHKSADADVKFKCRVGVSMAKSVTHKLEEYSEANAIKGVT